MRLLKGKRLGFSEFSGLKTLMLNRSQWFDAELMRHVMLPQSGIPVFDFGLFCTEDKWIQKGGKKSQMQIKCFLQIYVFSN